MGVTAFALIPTALLAVVERRAEQAGHEPAAVGPAAEAALEAAA
jgi:hypothetical protein